MYPVDHLENYKVEDDQAFWVQLQCVVVVPFPPDRQIIPRFKSLPHCLSGGSCGDLYATF